jgi:hypothetical protein
MKTLASSLFLLCLLSGFWVAAGETGVYPIAVSPGSETGLATVSQCCPSFSWSQEAAMAGMGGKMDGGTEGADNTFYGQGAGAVITSGIGDTFIGVNAGQSNTTANYNTFIGYNAGVSNTTGYQNTFIGRAPGYSNTTGFYNTFLGHGAGYSNTTGNDNTFIGMSAGFSNTTGANNTLIGNYAGQGNTMGGYNTFLGYGAGGTNTTGSGNIIIGSNAGHSNTTGVNNTVIGSYAGYSNTDGFSNVFLGNYAGFNETGSNKLYIDNTSTGDPLIYGEFDTNIVNINGKLGVGTKTPGYPIEVARTGTNASIVLNRTDGAKNYVNATATFGNFGTVNNYPLRLVVNSLGKMTLNSDNSMSMASGATCTAGGVWTNASSIALKENISALGSDEAATTLQALNPVKYNYKAEKDENHVGFIAEEVPELVAMKDRKSLSPMDIVAVLTKVTQDQQNQLQEQKQITQKQQQQLQDQQQINEKMKMEIAELQKVLSK